MTSEGKEVAVPGDGAEGVESCASHVEPAPENKIEPQGVESPEEGEASTFTEALMGGDDENIGPQQPSTGGDGAWSNIPRQDKARRTTWDVSFCGRFIVWLVFIATMVLVTFVVPYLLKGVDFSGNRSSAAGAAGAGSDYQISIPYEETPNEASENKPSTMGTSTDANPSQSRMDNVKYVILQNDITSEATLKDETSNAHYALQWISEVDPAQVEPLVNYHDNTELLQRYALAVLYYSTHPTVNANEHSQGIATSDSSSSDISKEEAGKLPPISDTETIEKVLAITATSTSAPTAAPQKQLLDEPKEQTALSSSLLPQGVHLSGHEEAQRSNKNETADAHLSLAERDDEMADAVVAHVSRHDRDGESPNGFVEVKVERHNAERVRSRNLGGGWLVEDKWMTASHVCDWYGIECEKSGPHQVVTSVKLESNGLRGNLPSELQALSKLVVFNVSSNELNGQLPATLWKTLPSIEVFAVSQNRFSGSIYSSIDHLSNLQDLDLSSNALTGEIPTEMAKLVQLKSIRLENNVLKGSIPSLADLKNLTLLRLGGNQLTGSIPYHVSLLRKLFDLGLQRNMLTGTLLAEIDELKHLRHIDLSTNALSGELPNVFQRLKNLESLNLEGNSFKSKLPTSLGILPNFKKLILSSNEIEGSIPIDWAGMTSLQVLALAKNRLTGHVPVEILQFMPALETLMLDDNKMTGTLSSDLGMMTSLQNVTLEGNAFEGSVPAEFCALKESGSLAFITADCSKVQCDCCDN